MMDGSGDYFIRFPPNQPPPPITPARTSLNLVGEESRDSRTSSRDNDVDDFENNWRASHPGQSAPFLPCPTHVTSPVTPVTSSYSNHPHYIPSPKLPPPPPPKADRFQDKTLFSSEEDYDDDGDDERDFVPSFHQVKNRNICGFRDPDFPEEEEYTGTGGVPRIGGINNGCPSIAINIIFNLQLLSYTIRNYVLNNVRDYIRDKIEDIQATENFSREPWKAFVTVVLLSGAGSQNRGRMTRRVLDYESTARIALESRIILLLIQVIAINLSFIPKHENDGFKFQTDAVSDKVLDNLVQSVFGGGSNWDGQYFMHIAINGYTEESTVAFFPLFPMLLYVIARPIYTLLWWCLSLSSIVLVVGWCLNAILFMKTAQALYKIAERYQTQYGHTLTSTAVIIFCFNPASVFFSALYTESLFSFLTTSVVLSLIERNVFWALFWASLSTLCRSNGLLNFGFIVFYWVQEENFKPVESITSVVVSFFITLARKTLLVLPFLVPFVVYQYYAIQKFCEGQNQSADYCKFYVLPYAYVQKKYWNVGFMRYFELKQTPNFVLALPVLYFTVTESWKRFRMEVLDIMYGYTWENAFSFFSSGFGVFLAVFCFLNIHVQVSTRLILAAFPYLYIYLAESCCSDVFQLRKYVLDWPITAFSIHSWCLLYFLLGGILFPLGYPWT